MELLFILYKPLARLLNCKANTTIQNNKCHIFLKYLIFLDQLKDSSQIKRNYVKAFDVRHDAKQYRASQGITGPRKMHFFNIISFLNDSKFYDEERNELS